MAVQFMRITCGQTPAPQALQIRMGHHYRYQPFAQTLAPLALIHENVAQIGKGGTIADHTSEANLRFPAIQTEADRVLKRAMNDFTRPALSPISTREKSRYCI